MNDIKARHKDCGFEVEVIGAPVIWWCYKCKGEVKMKDIIWCKGIWRQRMNQRENDLMVIFVTVIIVLFVLSIVLWR